MVGKKQRFDIGGFAGWAIAARVTFGPYDVMARAAYAEQPAERRQAGHA